MELILERAVELALIAAATWPAVVLLASATFRRLWSRLARRLAVALAGYVVFVIAVAVVLPAALPVLAAAAVGFMIWERWRARPAYGQSRHWPPGSLDATRLGVARDDRYLSNQAAQHGPVFKIGYFEPVACVVGHGRANDLLETHGEAMRALRTPPFNDLIPRGFLRFMASDDHARYRRRLQSALSPALVNQLEPVIEAEIAAALGRIAEESSRSAAGRHVKEDLREMTLAIFLRAVYGVPSDAPTAEQMQSLHGVITTERMVATPPGEMRKAYEGLVDLVREQGQRLEGVGTAPPGCVLAALQATDPAVLDDETMVGNLIYIAETGRTDVAGLLNWVVRKMAENPIWAERLRAEPESGQTSAGLAARIVKETLRLEQSEYLLRSAREDLEVEGKVIPKGWLVRLCIREGHRDPAVFEDPERFDPDRFKERTYTNREYAPFGLDNHRCIGSAWTEAIGRLFVTRLVRDYDLDVVDIGTTHHGTMHWEPGPDFRIRLTRRSQTA